MKAFWGECSPFSSPSMHLFSSTYRIRVKAKKRKTADARAGTRTREMQRKLSYMLFWINTGKQGGTPLPLAPNGQGDRGRSAQKRHIGKRAGHFPMCSFAKGKGEERELKPKGISGGVLIEQCVVLSSSVVHVVLCRVDGCGHLHSVLQLLIG